MPTQGYACGIDINNVNIINSGKMDCCKPNSCNGNKTKNNCSENCRKNSCRCSIFITVFSIPAMVEIKTKNSFVYTQKQKIYYKKANISYGFHFIWLPPKIS